MQGSFVTSLNKTPLLPSQRGVVTARAGLSESQEGITALAELYTSTRGVLRLALHVLCTILRSERKRTSSSPTAACSVTRIEAQGGQDPAVPNLFRLPACFFSRAQQRLRPPPLVLPPRARRGSTQTNTAGNASTLINNRSEWY